MIHAVDSNCTIAEVAASAPGGLRWMQIYLFKDRLLTQHLIREAEKAGYKAIVIAVDSPCSGLSPRLLDVFNKDHLSSQPKYWCVFQGASHITKNISLVIKIQIHVHSPPPPHTHTNHDHCGRVKLRKYGIR